MGAMTVSAGPESPRHAAARLVRAQVHHSRLLNAVLGLAALSSFCGQCRCKRLDLPVPHALLSSCPSIRGNCTDQPSAHR